MGELWELLCSAQENIGGIPAKFVEQKKEEIKKRQVGIVHAAYLVSTTKRQKTAKAAAVE